MRSKLEMVAMRVQQMAEIVGLTVKVQTVDWEDLAARAAERIAATAAERMAATAAERMAATAAKRMAARRRDRRSRRARRYKGT